MKAKVIRTGFIGGRLVHEGEVIEVSKPGSWYEAIKPAKGGKSEADKGAADSAAALT